MKAKKVITISFAVVLVDMLGVGILIPIIPLLFTDPAYPYYLDISLSNGYLLLGALTALYPFTQFIALPILGQLSDTFGRKPVLALSLLGSGLAFMLFALGIITRNIPLLFLARGLDGVTGGSIAVVQAATADVTKPEDRVRTFSIISAANGVGFILGPLVGALLSDSSILSWFKAPTPFWAAAIFSGLNMIAVIMFYPETLKVRTKKRIRIWQSFQNIRNAASGLELRPLYITSFLFQSGFAFIVTFFGVYLVARFGFGQSQIGYLFAFVGLMLALTQIFITRPLSRHAKPNVIIPVSLAVMSLSLICVYVSYDQKLLYLATIPAAITAGLVLTNLTALISTTSQKHQQGSVLGINSSVQALAQSIPPLFAGVIAAIFAPTTPVLFSAFVIFIAAAFFMWYYRPLSAARRSAMSASR